MTEDFEQLQAEREKALSQREQFDRRLGRLPDHEFDQIASELCREGDQVKAKAGPPPPPPGVVQPDEMGSDLDQLNDKEFSELQREIGISSTRLEAPLSQEIAWDNELASDADFDAKMDRWSKRNGGQ